MKVQLLVLLFIFTNSLKAEDTLRRSLSLNFGYVETFFNSNEALVHAPMSFIAAHSKLFDITTENFRDAWWKRLINIVFEAPLSFWLSAAFSFPFHEFGHARAVSALGFPYVYGSLWFNKHHFRNIKNYWGLFAIRLITPPWQPAYTAFYIKTANLNIALYRQKGEGNGLGAIVYGAGINNQMFLAKNIGTTIYENNGHLLYSSHYIMNKINGAIYASVDDGKTGDPSLLIHAYRQRGYNIERYHLQALSWLSLVSGSTIAFLYGYYRYLVHNDEIVKPIEIFGFRLPELQGYFNANGLSFEIETDYRIFDNFTVGIAYEFMWKGRMTHEVSPRLRYNFASLLPNLNALWFKAGLVIGKGIGASISAELIPLAFDKSEFSTRFSYYFDMTIHDARTLYGERNIFALDRGNIFASSAFFGLRLNY